MRHATTILFLVAATAQAVDDFPKPYSPPCTERENVFEFTEKPAARKTGEDQYEITFAVKGNCDATVGIIDGEGKVVRHLGSGVLGANAPAPFQRNSLRQTLYWNGKDDLDQYVGDPGKMRVRVMLGLKLEFDKQLGGTSPYNIPGYVWGLAADEGGVYTFIKGGRGRFYIRKFGHDGRYLQSLVPPPPDLPEAKLAGMGYVEYEPGRKAIHNTVVGKSTAIEGYYLAFSGRHVRDCQPALFGGRLFYANSGDGAPSLLYSVGTDGSTTVEGCAGLSLTPGIISHVTPRLAASPDGKWLYFIDTGQDDDRVATYVVWRRSLTGPEPARPFIGQLRKPGSDNRHLLSPRGVDCDAQGRIYVCDNMNNRIQIFSPGGEHMRALDVDRPAIVRVHQKDGSLYVLHQARVEGQSVSRITKYAAFGSLKKMFHQDGYTAVIMAVDSWSPRPRLWIGGGLKDGMDGRLKDSYHSFRVLEDTGSSLVKTVDFEAEATKEAAGNYFGRWPGGSKQSVVADPKNERVFYLNRLVFDLRTGKLTSIMHLPGPSDDIAIDKRGYVHCHFNPGFYQQGVARMDPDQAKAFTAWDANRAFPNLRCKEVPYDYGVESAKDGFLGVLPVKDQPGAKFFQDGIGVNMRGDVAENCNIYYAPKMQDEVKRLAVGAARTSDAEYGSGGGVMYESFLRDVMNMEKQGEEVYSIRRQPGVPTVGATIWTFDRSGQMRAPCAVTFGGLINGVQIDEDGCIYFVGNRPKWVDGKSFLAGHGGTFGLPDSKANRDPFMGALLKTRGRAVKATLPGAPTPMDQLPARPPELVGNDWGFGDGRCWVEGVEWVYGGASPIVWPMNCSCPTLRFSTDWYKRTFVPEAYRHSIGILDTAGNLILHHGHYANFDGPPGVGMVEPRCVAATDSYLCYDDLGERLVVLKLNYHAEETVQAGNQ